MEDKLNIKSTLEVDNNPELYKIIDFLNKNLKEKHVIFGLSMKSNKKMMITIYETE